MSQLRTTSLHARSLGADRAPLYRLSISSRKYSMHAKRQSLVTRNVGAWDSASTQQGTLTGQTVAAQIRRRVAIFVEPSPFSHVSGMKNRFECLIQGLRGTLPACGQRVALLVWFTYRTRGPVAELGDDVTVVTPDVNPPKHYFGARVSNPSSLWALLLRPTNPAGALVYTVGSKLIWTRLQCR